MAGIVTALGVINTLLTALNHPLLKEAFLSLSYGNRLKKLKSTVTTVKSLLLDAANKGDELSHTTLDYVDKLKDAVYDADDLFDELVTKAERKKLFGSDDDIFEKVRYLLPSVKTSLRVKKQRLRLKDIADDHDKFKLSIDTTPHRKLRVETLSYVAAPTVVGRDDDATEIINMLLDSTKDVNFLTLVGVGGVGKTTLAKLVYGDARIESVFTSNTSRLWVCVSDQDGAPLDVKVILIKILELLKCKLDSCSSIEFLHNIYRSKVKGEKLFLVLDDVWNESRIELNNLKELLMIDGSEIRILATTRSMKMAKFIGGCIHELKGLTDDNSRRLFEMVAFGKESKPNDFVEVAEKIVKTCSNIPLVIKVVGSLLYDQPIGKWHTFLTGRFANFSKEENEIMSILKTSYDYLDPSLKSCFTYCAIFPKDFVIKKEMIITLWDAQGYIVPFDDGQSIESAGEEHFSILLQRCFFQEVVYNMDGDVESFKIHDLMHDLAQRVSGKEICMLNSSMHDLDYRVRHLSVSAPTHSNMPVSISSSGPMKTKIRSYLMLQNSQREDVKLSDELLSLEMSQNWRCLRALALESIDDCCLGSIDKLIHLRYLNLAYSKMKKLPNSIVKLHNLQTLNLSDCEFLEEWPKEFSKLVNLTHLYTDGCYNLHYMPVGMSNLSRMCTLTNFVVEDESAGGMQRVAQLTDLKALVVNLKGRIRIRFGVDFKGVEGYDWEGSCFEHAEHLNEVVVHFPHDTKLLDAQIVMEKLKPHRNLRNFSFRNSEVTKIATWGSAQVNWATFFPNLVSISLYWCHRVQELPMLSKLGHLKHLFLYKLYDLKYIEEDVSSNSGSGSLDTTFFPSLEYVHFYALRNLESWWRPGHCNESHCQPAFPNLSTLTLMYCRRLKSFPPCLSSPKIYLSECNNVAITTADGVYTSKE